MKIAVVGCRDGEYLFGQIVTSGLYKYEIICFADNNKALQGTRIRGIMVYSLEDMALKYKSGEIEGVIIAVRKGYSRFCLIEQLNGLGINDIILLKPSPLTFRLPIVFDEQNELYTKQWLVLREIKKPIIHHLEIHVANGCNLNCKGCLHFSNLYQKDEFPDLKMLLRNIKVINKQCEIFQLRVLGGEPLLNPEIENFLEELREILPDCDISVISNGILIPRMKKSLYRVMRENYIGFNITLYIPTLKMKDKIYDTLQENGVAYGSHEAKTDKFMKFLTTKMNKSNAKTYTSCEPRGILVIKDDCIYKCPIEAYIGKYFDRFQIPLQHSKGIKIEGIRDWGELVYDLYTKPVQMCKYCSEKPEYYEWSNGKPEKEDWLVNG